MTPETKIKSNLAAERNLHNWLEVLDFLFILSERDLEHDRLTESPFATMSIDQILARDAVANDRTPTLLPQDMLRAMTAAAKYVSTYSPYVIEAFRQQRRIQKGEAPSKTFSLLGPPDGVQIVPRFSLGCNPKPPNTMLLREAVRHLLASCAILIGSFAARRDIGVRSAHHGCLEDDGSGVLRMSIYIAKTVKDRASVPVPEILRSVVKALEEISEDTREKRGTEWLFDVASSLENPDRLISSKFHEIIDEFLEFADVDPPDGADRWNLSIHMLRRGYGIWYFYGLTGGSTDALSMMYFHYDPLMTRVYFTEALPGEINRLQNMLAARLRSAASNRSAEDQEWIDNAYEKLSYLKTHHQAFNEARCEKFVEKVAGLWRGTESVIGAGGQTLFNNVQAIAERAMASIRIGSRANDPEALEIPLMERLNDLASTHFLDPVLGTNMWCTATPGNPDHLADAECLKLKNRGRGPWASSEVPADLLPDYGFACNRLCLNCRFGAAFNDGQEAIREEVERHRYAVSHAATATLKDEGEQLLAELEHEIEMAGPVRRGGGL